MVKRICGIFPLCANYTIMRTTGCCYERKLKWTACIAPIWTNKCGVSNWWYRVAVVLQSSVDPSKLKILISCLKTEEKATKKTRLYDIYASVLMHASTSGFPTKIYDLQHPRLLYVRQPSSHEYPIQRSNLHATPNSIHLPNYHYRYAALRWDRRVAERKKNREAHGDAWRVDMGL